MEDCIFCKISSGQVPSSKIYEDDNFFVFLDIDPVTKGHTLIVPKKHIRWIHEADNDVVSRSFILAKDFINHIRDVLSCDYVQLIVAGEEVPHLHIHLIPAYLGKELATWKKVKYESPEEIQYYVNKMHR